MKTTWNPSECYQLAKKYIPEKNLDDLRLHIYSIPWNFSLCRYHKDEYHKLLGSSITAGMNKELVESIGKLLEMSASTEEGIDFRLILFFAEAHVIAFAQALHSTADILAHIIEICLKLNMTNRQINFSNAIDVLEKHKIAPSVYSKAIKIRNSKEFIYLNAFVNTIKHRRLIEMPYHVNLEPGNEIHGLKVKYFKYGRRKTQETSFEPRWVHEFINDDFEKISNTVGELGVELNHYMKAYLVK